VRAQRDLGGDGSKVRVLDPIADGLPRVSQPPPQGQPPPRPHRFLPVALAFFALAAAWLVALAAGTDEPGPPGTTTPPAAQAPPTIAPGRVAVVLQAPEESGGMISWAAASLGSEAVVNDIVQLGGLYLAVGSLEGAPAAWRSPDGIQWRSVAVGGADEPGSIDVLSTNGATPGDIIAIGQSRGRAAVWRPPLVPQLELVGIEPELSAAELVATVRLGDAWLVLGRQAPSGDSLGEPSGDAVTSTSWLGSPENGWSLVGTIPGSVSDVVVHDGVVYAVGAQCIETGCRPAIWTSFDGADWEPVATESTGLPGSISLRLGDLSAVAAAGDTLIAVGAIGTGEGSRAAIWRSIDGKSWRETLPGEGAGVTIVIAAMALPLDDDTPTAIVEVGGERFEVTTGTVIETDLGDVLVRAVDRDGVHVVYGCTPYGQPEGTCGGSMSPGRPLEIGGLERATHVAAFGERVVVSGVEGVARSRPLTWTSKDSGTTWRESVVTGTGAGTLVATRLADVALIVAEDGESTVALRGVWRTSEEIAAGLDKVDRLVAALNGSGTANDLVDLLAKDDPATLEIRGLPGIGPMIPHWVSDSGRRVRTAAVSDTLEFAAVTRLDVTLTQCSGTHDFEAGLTRVRCGYLATSAVLERLGLMGFVHGTLVAHVSDGGITYVSVTGNEEHPLLQLAEWVLWTDPLRFAPTFGSLAGDGSFVVDPALTRAAARRQLRLARQYAAASHQAASPFEASTPFGSMQFYPWSTSGPGDDPAATYPDVTYDGRGYVALQQRTSSTWALFTSQDGQTWTGNIPETDAELTRFLGAADHTIVSDPSGEALWEWTGTGLLPIDLERPEGTRAYATSAASRAGVTLIVGNTDHADSATGISTWRYEAGTATRVFDPRDVGIVDPIITATDSWFLMLDRTNGIAARSDDGVTWDQAAQLTLPGASVVEALWVVGETVYANLAVDASCVPGSVAITACRPSSSVRRLIGGAWEEIEGLRLETAFAGPHGIVAVAKPKIDHHTVSGPLLMSVDGETWQPLGAFYPVAIAPGSTRRVSGAAVGDDGMLILVQNDVGDTLLVGSLR